MKILFNMLLLMGGLCGMGIAFLSDVTVSSTIDFLNGMQLSIVLGAFSIIVIISSIMNLFSSNQ